MKIRLILVLIMFGLVFSMNLLAEDETGKEEFSHLNIVVTAQDHFDLASVYRKRAAYYRRQADDHKGMKEVYRKSADRSKGSVRESWEAMDEHCDAIISQLNGLAVMMDQQAEWHEERGSWQKG